MRSANSVTNAALSRNWCAKCEGSKLIPKPSRWSIAASVLRVVGEVVGDLGRVDLERELHALGVEDVDDRREALGELLVAALDLGEVVRREAVEHVPDRRAGEAGDDVDAEPGGGAGGVLELVGGAPADALGVAVAPDVGRHDALVAGVDRVADGLADEVVADRQDAEAVALEQLAAAAAVGVVRERGVDVEVVAPAGELEAVEAPGAGLLGELGERQVGPLAGEQGDGSWHGARRIWAGI